MQHFDHRALQTDRIGQRDISNNEIVKVDIANTVQGKTSVAAVPPAAAEGKFSLMASGETWSCPGFPFSKWITNLIKCAKSPDRYGFGCGRETQNRSPGAAGGTVDQNWAELGRKLTERGRLV
jgi:hypothetical protein